MSFTYTYARAALTVDCVIFGLDDRGLNVLLIRRALPPHQGDWALPGGFVDVDETVDAAARRELREETGLQDVFLEQLYTFGAVDRDPRERAVSVAYYALVNLRDHNARAASDAADAKWFPVRDLPRLAFDHASIMETAQQRLQGKVRYQPIGFALLPPKFTLTELQTLYEVVLARPLDRRNFRKKIQAMGILLPTDEYQEGVAHRAARLYRFDEDAYEKLTHAGWSFEV